MTKKIFFIVGEPSGDALGAGLMRALKEQAGEDIIFSGVGGALMAEQGLKSLLPMNELCVMGLWEVIWQLPRLMSMINAVVLDIEKFKPDAVVMIDLPDFNFQVAAKLKKRGIAKAKLIHYVAPSVWAWRPGRAKKIAGFLDGLMCLFPFEPGYFTKHKLNSVFVGHPIVENVADQGDGKAFRARRGISDTAPVLGLFFGSRQAELQTMSAVLKDVALVFKGQYPDLHIVMPTLPNLEYDVMSIGTEIGVPAFAITNQDIKKWDAIKACDVAVAVSGTVGLELAYAGIPHVIAYKMHPLTWMAVKSMVKVKFAHLANILLGEAVIPEFLQSRCTSYHISKELLMLYKMPERKAAQIAGSQKMRALLGSEDGQKPSRRAAKFVLDMIRQ